MSALRWIHLSDLHMQKDDLDHREVVLDSLWQEIEKKRNKGFSLDFIVFTGDVAYHAKQEEYELAKDKFFLPLLKATGLSREKLFMVPGNHDVSRIITKLMKSPLDNIKEEDDIREYIRNKEVRQALFQPQKNYKDFFKSFLADIHNEVDALFASFYGLKKEDKNVALLGLNSAFLSGHNWIDKETVFDKNFLAIGELQIRQALKNAQNSDLVICFQHHPFDWLFEFDSEMVLRWIVKNCDLHLRGHLHKSDYSMEANLLGNLISIPSGAVYDNRKANNSFNYVELDLENGKGTIYFRKFTESHGWQKDIELTGSALDGKKEFIIDRLSSQLDESGAPTLTFTEPVWDVMTVKYSERCDADLVSFGITREQLEDLVEREFVGHKSYYYYDIEIYPLTIKGGFIVFFSKAGRTIKFESMVKAVGNQAQLSNWNAITQIYRLCTRYGYRKSPERLLLIPGMLDRVIYKHTQILSLITSYYDQYEGLLVDFIKREAVKKVLHAKSGSKTHGKEMADLITRYQKESDTQHYASEEISALLLGASDALKDAKEIYVDYENKMIDQRDATELSVIKLETSLQNIHKIIISHPPKAS